MLSFDLSVRRLPAQSVNHRFLAALFQCVQQPLHLPNAQPQLLAFGPGRSEKEREKTGKKSPVAKPYFLLPLNRATIQSSGGFYASS
jgi:hypothetical protein